MSLLLLLWYVFLIIFIADISRTRVAVVNPQLFQVDADVHHRYAAIDLTVC